MQEFPKIPIDLTLVYAPLDLADDSGLRPKSIIVVCPVVVVDECTKITQKFSAFASRRLSCCVARQSKCRRQF